MTRRSPLIYLRFALATAACLLLSASVFGMTIYSAVAVGPQLTITGTGFSGTLSITFNGSHIVVDSSTTTQIVATINPLPPAGTYRVVVRAGTASDTVYVTLSNNVAKVSLLNQSASIPLTTLWTPALDGVYRVSIYMVQVPPFAPVGVCCGFVTLEFEWTDDAGTQSQSDTSNQSTAASISLLEGGCGGSSGACPELQVPGGSPGAVFILQVKGGTPIQYTTAYQSTQTGPAYYDLFMTLDQI